MEPNCDTCRWFIYQNESTGGKLQNRQIPTIVPEMRKCFWAGGPCRYMPKFSMPARGRGMTQNEIDGLLRVIAVIDEKEDTDEGNL